jgi:hypothetical protein
MAALPLSALQQRQQHTALTPKTRGQLHAERIRIHARMRLLLRATFALAILGLAGLVYLPFSAVPDAYCFGAQEVLAVAVFATCLFLLHARTDLHLRLYNYEPVEQTTQGELRALLHRVPEGASYQNALAADNRTFTTGEVDQIRRRAEAFAPKTVDADPNASTET